MVSQIYFLTFVVNDNSCLIYFLELIKEKCLKKLQPVAFDIWQLHFKMIMNLQIKEPTVCGITSLGMDHTEILGKYVSYFLNILPDALHIVYWEHNMFLCWQCGFIKLTLSFILHLLCFFFNSELTSIYGKSI